MEEIKSGENSGVVLSIIIPLGPGDLITPELNLLIDKLPSNIETIIVSNDDIEFNEHTSTTTLIKQKGSRASSMNLGAEKAIGRYLLFLHADSYIDIEALNTLISRIEKEQSALFYFNFHFFKGMPFWYKLTELGVWFRCTFLKTPFGDQGLVLSKVDFIRCGGFNLKTKYGEDHLLVRECRKKNMKILSTGRNIYTSPRKYLDNGWLRTTIRHQYMWYKQIYDDIRGVYK